MRFMILIKADRNTEAGIPPSRALIEAMGRYNEELAKAGVMLAGEGLQPSAKGARVRFSGNARSVEDGPFPLDQGLICGFWIFRTGSKQEAIDWVKRCPNPLLGDAEIEIRPIFELEDFGDTLTPELRAREEELRAKLENTSRASGS